MSFAKHPTFEPSAVQVMADAMDEAWAILEERDVGRGNPQELRLELAKRIIELASYGDYDAQTLRDTAVASLASPQYRRRGPQQLQC